MNDWAILCMYSYALCMCSRATRSTMASVIAISVALTSVCDVIYTSVYGKKINGRVQQ